MMQSKLVRAAGLLGLAAGMLGLTGGILPAQAGTASTASGTVDTGGTAVVAVPGTLINNLAKAGIVVLPTGPGTAAYAGNREKITLAVSGGDATFVGTTGTLDLSGGLRIADGWTRRSVTLTDLTFSYNTATIYGKDGTRRVAIGQVGGSLNGTQSAGPPASQTFTASAVLLTKSGAKFLDAALKTSYLTAGRNLASFATTYDIGSAS